jgi:hypothetical protein
MHGFDRDIAITPDGSRIIYRGDSQLFVRALDQLEPDVLLTGLAGPRSVFVSPDGQWVDTMTSHLMAAASSCSRTCGPPPTPHLCDPSSSCRTGIKS